MARCFGMEAQGEVMNIATVRLNNELQAQRVQIQAIDPQRFELYKTMLLGAEIRGDLEANPRPVMLRCWKNAGIAMEACKQPEHRFPMVHCSQCGKGFGPGDSGFSDCKDHQHLAVVED